ncbi:MAG: hypothetical protein L7V86_11460 [Verrucomicrobiales bacterium]|jgi:N-glycosylase/DNA lyase|nr:hypothetical protein [Verrucomicrobiales bacterium]
MKCQRLDLGDRALDLNATLHCGQVFHWTAGGDGQVAALGEKAVWISHVRKDNTLLYQGCKEETLERYLGLDLDLSHILKTFPGRDSHLAAAMDYTPGLRLCRQPTWECLASFITSSLKQVPHIRKISLTLRQRFGKSCKVGEHTVWAYPTPAELAAAGEEALRECGLGYRAKSLALAAERIASGEFSLDDLETEEDTRARKRLCELHGVGEKIADCVLLFGYGRLAAFPIDVWVERVLKRLYAPRGKKKKWPRAEMQAYAAKYFGPYAGYAQQYLFHYARHHDKMLFGDR